jgi:integrase
MPKIAQELTALQVARIKEQGDHHVGGVPGLLLRVAGQSRVWVLRARVNEVRRNIGLGSYPATSLLQAREKAREKRAAIDAGDGAPLTKTEARKARLAQVAAAVTFKEAAQSLIKSRRAEWKNLKHAQQWENTLADYAYPKLGEVAVPDLDVAMIMGVLEPIWLTKTETASRLRGRIEAVIDYACVKHSIKMDNPARWKGHLDVLLPKKSKVAPVEHHEAVPWKKAREAVDVIHGARGIAAKALQATLLTACRTNEVLGMRKGDVIVSEALWIIPAERMKIPRDHYVPLSRQALQLLQAVGLDGKPDELVFTSTQKSRAGQELSDGAMLQVMKKNGIAGTPHGWRSTFRDWAGEATGYANELCELALAHTIANKAEAAYRRGDMLEKRRPLMQEWADYVMPVVG